MAETKKTAAKKTAKKKVASKSAKPKPTKRAALRQTSEENGSVARVSGALTKVVPTGSAKTRVRFEFEHGHITLRPTGNRSASVALITKAVSDLLPAR